jgi:glycosyltransferase involved in cell wall biosynthesis
MSKNITVIIPAKIRTLQEAEWLKIAITSVPKEYSIVIVNDHSLIDWSNVSTICELTKSKNVYHLSDKTGLAAARNRAMYYVKTEFFFPLDADDYLEPGALETVLEKYPGDGFVYGATHLFDDRRSSTYLARPYDICKLLDAVYWPNGCLQKKENWEKISGWDETLPLYEDWDYWIRSFKAGIYGHSIPDLLYHYRQNPIGIISTLKRTPEMVTKARGIIQNKHLDLFSGESPMCNCGKKKVDLFAHISKKTRTISSENEETIHIKASEGLVMITYVGSNMTQSYYGLVTGTCYRFGVGKNKYGYVAETDVTGFLSLVENKKHLFTL